MAAPHWLALFALVLAGWAVLYAMALPADLRGAAGLYGADFWRSLCVVAPDQAGFWGLAAMWAVMSAAMMAPTSLPAFASFDDFIGRGAASRTDFTALVGGYLAIWLGFSLIAAALQLALFRAGLVSPVGQSLSPLLSGGLLIFAGAYQFSALKNACLTQCREPLSFFLHYWRDDRWNAGRLGILLGAVCLGCCWALMVLAFVGGTMNLSFMGLATLIMIFEKLPELGRPVTRPLGVILIAAGLFFITTGAAALL